MSMNFDKAELQFIADQIPSLTHGYPSRPEVIDADFVYTIAARWNANTVKHAYFQGFSLSTAPLNHAHDWLLKPTDTGVLSVKPYIAGVRTDIIASEDGGEEEVLVILLSAGYKNHMPIVVSDEDTTPV